jgi:hypothetical protein
MARHRDPVVSARNAEIARLYNEGVLPKEIGIRLSMGRQLIHAGLKRAYEDGVLERVRPAGRPKTKRSYVAEMRRINPALRADRGRKSPFSIDHHFQDMRVEDWLRLHAVRYPDQPGLKPSLRPPRLVIPPRHQGSLYSSSSAMCVDLANGGGK